MSACDDKRLLLQAHADGELDAANALALETHLRTCPGCAEELSRIEAVRGLLKGVEPRKAPAALAARIGEAIDAEAHTAVAPRRLPASFGRGWASGLITGIAASLLLVVAVPQMTRGGVEGELAERHATSLEAANPLTDIATSNRHVVKPWFNGKIDFAPSVPELAPQGFPLVGGRVDEVGGRKVAALVYRRRLHTVTVFVRPAGVLALPDGGIARRKGYSLVRWTHAGLEYWAVSDIDPGDLQLFRRTFESQPSL